MEHPEPFLNVDDTRSSVPLSWRHLTSDSPTGAKARVINKPFRIKEMDINPRSESRRNGARIYGFKIRDDVRGGNPMVCLET